MSKVIEVFDKIKEARDFPKRADSSVEDISFSIEEILEAQSLPFVISWGFPAYRMQYKEMLFGLHESKGRYLIHYFKVLEEKDTLANPLPFDE